MHFRDCVGVEAAGNRTREVTRFNRTPATALAGAAREQLPKWRHTNRQFMATRRWAIMTEACHVPLDRRGTPRTCYAVADQFGFGNCQTVAPPALGDTREGSAIAPRG